MGRMRLPEDQRRSRVLRVCATVEEEERVKSAAVAARAPSMSAFALAAILNACPKPKRKAKA